MFHETSIDEPGVSLRTVRGTQPSCLEYSIGDSCELTSDVLHTSKLDDAVANSLEIDFALVLARTIDSIKDDPSLLRNMVYELARSKLLTLGWEQKPRIRTLELRRLLLSFETAVQHVERRASREDELCTPGSVPGLVSSAHFAKEVDRGDSILIVDQTVRPTEALKAKSHTRRAFRMRESETGVGPQRCLERLASSLLLEWHARSGANISLHRGMPPR